MNTTVPTSSGHYSQSFIARATDKMRGDAAGGVMLVIAAILGFTLANSPLSGLYEKVRDFTVGPESLDLHLSIGQWASDGLLAIFFFMVGLELKREFVAGDLRNPKAALVPVAAAFGGVAVPALIYVAFNWGEPTIHGWAIPAATDIAFAVAVLGLVAPRIPTTLRIFLLTLAVVDDLIAIAIIAVAYTQGLNWLPLVIAIVPVVLYAILAQKFGVFFKDSKIAPWLVLLPIGAIVWALMHASGIHATVAGVLLAFTVPVKGKHGEEVSDIFVHRFTPLSVGVAVPIFAFFATGVSVSGEHDFPASPIAIGIIAGLVLGKPIGIVLTTLIITKFTSAKLASKVATRDLIGVSALAGVGFTVSLLITDLSFTNQVDTNTGRLAVIVASLIAIAVASVLLIRKRERGETQVLAVVEDTRAIIDTQGPESR